MDHLIFLDHDFGGSYSIDVYIKEFAATINDDPKNLGYKKQCGKMGIVFLASSIIFTKVSFYLHHSFMIGVTVSDIMYS